MAQHRDSNDFEDVSNIETQIAVIEDSVSLPPAPPPSSHVKIDLNTTFRSRPIGSAGARVADNISTLAQFSFKQGTNTDKSTQQPSLVESQRDRQFEPQQRKQTTIGASSFTHYEYKSSSVPSRTPNLSNAWEFAGWGSTYYFDLPPNMIVEDETSNSHLLGQWRAVSISGNDLLASVLYTIGITTVVSGKYAPLCFLITAFILYPFKNILSEVGTALPLNGGAYNCLLNTSAKWVASIAATLSLLDYIATAVVSGASATAYLSTQVEISNTVTFWSTIGVLLVFAGIVLMGLQESSTIAFVIFSLHCLTLTLLIIVSVVRWCIQGNGTLIENWKNPGSGNAAFDIFKGVCVGLLGATGFETSSNFIEDQKPGVFPKTMRNMWLMVLFFNVSISLLSTAILPLSTFSEYPNSLISIMGAHAGGEWLRTVIVVDAVIVLCAGVLTGFVGVTGLIVRMASDQILPQFLLIKNRFTGTNHWIILSFLILCITLFAVEGGDVTSLTGVFSVSFLSVLCMFAIGCILLKYKRGRLYRPIQTSTGIVILGLACVVIALIGNIIIAPSIVHDKNDQKTQETTSRILYEHG
ncbi:10155_t:CDS:2 [Ambispora leptoticha]|uniref:10155_t:CDS:1 n=1 Tax=Ambispora leptoticha TaxID=144679 RepID=A0A9N8VQ29_9GLOM|nr:10155_t:CDS:2 [Ambispora leptoticha]